MTLPIVTTDSPEAQEFIHKTQWPDAMLRKVAMNRLLQREHARRSAAREVRNPVLALPAAQRLLDAPPEVRALVADLMGDIALDARDRAEKSWRTHKAPMAAYWKAVSVYAGHIKRVARMGPGR